MAQVGPIFVLWRPLKKSLRGAYSTARGCSTNLSAYPVPLSQSGTGVSFSPRPSTVESIRYSAPSDLISGHYPTRPVVGYRVVRPVFPVRNHRGPFLDPEDRTIFSSVKSFTFYRLTSWVRSRQLATPSPLYIESSTLPCNTGFDTNFSRGPIFTKLGI